MIPHSCPMEPLLLTYASVDPAAVMRSGTIESSILTGTRATTHLMQRIRFFLFFFVQNCCRKRRIALRTQWLSNESPIRTEFPSGEDGQGVDQSVRSFARHHQIDLEPKALDAHFPQRSHWCTHPAASLSSRSNPR